MLFLKNFFFFFKSSSVSYDKEFLQKYKLGEFDLIYKKLQQIHLLKYIYFFNWVNFLAHSALGEVITNNDLRTA